MRTSSTISVIDSQAAHTQGGVSGALGQTSGLQIIGTHVLFDRCQTVHVRGDGQGDAFGFLVEVGESVDLLKGVTFRNCIVSDILAESQKTAAGYAVRSTTTQQVTTLGQVVFEGCIASSIRNNVSLFGQPERIAGIAVWADPGKVPLSDIVIKDCTVSDVQGRCEATAGIFLESVKNPIVCNNCVSDCVNGILFTGMTDEPGFTDCGLVQDNKVISCSKAGFKDLACPTQNAFICNTAFKNGTPARHNANYCINWKDEPPVCAGDLGRYPLCKKPFNLSLVPSINRCGKRC